MIVGREGGLTARRVGEVDWLRHILQKICAQIIPNAARDPSACPRPSRMITSFINPELTRGGDCHFPKSISAKCQTRLQRMATLADRARIQASRPGAWPRARP